MFKVYKGKLNTIISTIIVVSSFLIIFYVILDVISFSQMNHSVSMMLNHFEIREHFMKIIDNHNNMEKTLTNHYFPKHKKIDELNFNNYLNNLKRMFLFPKGDDCIYPDYKKDFDKLKISIKSLDKQLSHYQELTIANIKSSKTEIELTIKNIQETINIINDHLSNIKIIHNSISQNEFKTIYLQIHNNKKIRYILVLLSIILITSLVIIKKTLKDKFKTVKKILLSPERFTKEEMYYDFDDEFSSIVDNYLQMHKQTLKSINEIDFLKNYLHNIIDSMPSVVISMDENLKITQWNKNAHIFSEYDFERVKDKYITEVLPFFKNYENNLKEVHKNNQSFYINYHNDTEQSSIFEGYKKVWNIIVFPLTYNGVKGIVLRIDDVTELDKKEQLLRQAQKMEMIGTLAGGLSHDFNNILGGIIATLSILYHKITKQSTSANNKTKEMNTGFIAQQIELLMDLSEKAADLVKQLLTLSRKNEISLTPLDLNLSLKRVVKICKNSFDKSVSFNLSYYPESANILGDLNQIEQVLLNLFINACHAMTIMKQDTCKDNNNNSCGGVISVKINYINKINKHLELKNKTLEYSNSFSTLTIDDNSSLLTEKYWVISIADTGVGIDKYNISKILDPFFTTKKKDSGTGLGLSMVNNIIHKHHGFMDIYSEIEKGTVFNLYLPLYEDKNKASDIIKINHIKANFDTASKNLTIIVIEDDTVLRDIMTDILTECGFKVLSATDGKKGIKLLKDYNTEIKLIIVDMIMPNKSGLDVIKYTKKEFPNVRIILTSGFHNDNRIIQAKEYGINSFLAKPFTIHNLISEINKILSI